MADNEAMRVVLSALYHMVELIRNEELTESMSVDDPSLSSRRSSFLEELGRSPQAFLLTVWRIRVFPFRRTT